MSQEAMVFLVSGIIPVKLSVQVGVCEVMSGRQPRNTPSQTS